MNQSANSFSNRTALTTNHTRTEAEWAQKAFGIRWSAGVFTICLFGTLLNLSVLLILFRQKYHRTGSGILIINLVVIYFVLSVVIYPLNAVLALLQSLEVEIHQTSCRVINAMWASWLYPGNFFECSLVANRVVALVLPNHYRGCSSKKFMIPLSIAFWMVGLAARLPPALGAGGPTIRRRQAFA